MMQDQPVLSRIIDILKEGPKSITDIATAVDVDWRTASSDLEILHSLGLVKEKKIKQTRTFIYLSSKSYFQLPVPPKHEKKITALYAAIRLSCQKHFKTEPSKTQTYKVLWRVNKELDLKLPIGWYQFGPCCVQVFQGNEEPTAISQQETQLIDKWVQKYCSCSHAELQHRIYEEEKKETYLIKEKILQSDKQKETLGPLLMELIKAIPPESVEVTTDFARATLMLGWEKTSSAFPTLWKYLTSIFFRESLRPYYGDVVEDYMTPRIQDIKHEAQISILEIVQNHSGQRTGTKSQPA